MRKLVTASVLALSLFMQSSVAAAQEATTSEPAIPVVEATEPAASDSDANSLPDIPSGEALPADPATTTPDIEPASGTEESATDTSPTLGVPEVIVEDDTASTSDAVSAEASVASTTGTWLPDGTVITDGTWNKGGSPYVIEGETLVEGSLTVEPGVVVKLARDAALVLASGTFAVGGNGSGEEVTFTSIADDAAGGDTNGDGDGTDPDDNRWKHIYISSGTQADIAHARFRYAGGAATFALCHDADAAVSIQTCYDAVHNEGTIVSDGTMAIRDSLFEWEGVADLFVSQGMLSLERDRFDPGALFLNAWPPPTFLNIPRPVIEMRDSSIGATAYMTHGHALFDFKENWWGTPAGPPEDWYAAGSDPFEDVSAETYTEPWLTSDPFGAMVDPCAAGCASNILFLPGIEGSRLYDDDGKLWEPFDADADGALGVLKGSGDARVQELGLGEDGESLRSDIYAKDGDIIDESSGTKFYASFVAQMDGLESNGTIADWKAAAYDWRLSLPDIVDRGAEHDGKIYYEEATSTPYIEQTLRSLAASSKTGKVTIIAHSNGGLVAKALMMKLGATETARLIDKVVLVAVPQAGAPEAMGGLLFGYDEDITATVPHTDARIIPIVSSAAARTLAEHSPMAYHLLPSSAYLSDEGNGPLAAFEGDAYAAEESAYGPSAGTWSALSDFLSNGIGNRTKPAASDVGSANVLSPSLLSYAQATHDAIDAWRPPAGTTVYQIAGWGVPDTIAGIDFYSLPNILAGPLAGEPAWLRAYRPTFTDNGDGVVPATSALLVPPADNVKSYWLNLAAYSAGAGGSYAHGTIFETDALRNFLDAIIDASSELPPDVSLAPPAQDGPRARLRFMLNEPLLLSVYDAGGNHTGASADGPIEERIPGSSYGAFGAIRYASVPADAPYRVVIRSYAASTLALDVQEMSAGTATTSAIAGVPMPPGATATLVITNGVADASDLEIDEDGDAVTDIFIGLQPGQMSVYEPSEESTPGDTPIAPEDPPIEPPDDSGTTTPADPPEDTTPPEDSPATPSIPSASHAGHHGNSLRDQVSSAEPAPAPFVPDSVLTTPDVSAMNSEEVYASEETAALPQVLGAAIDPQAATAPNAPFTERARGNWLWKLFRAMRRLLSESYGILARAIRR